MDRFDKFTDDARRALTLAQEEAARLGHHYIGTEHLLLGLTLITEGVAPRVLHRLRVDPGRIRTAIEFIVGKGEWGPGEVGLTPRAKRVIELAIKEASERGHTGIGSGHLLLGLAREGEILVNGQPAGLALGPLHVRVVRCVRSDQIPGFGQLRAGDQNITVPRIIHGVVAITNASGELTMYADVSLDGFVAN